MPPSLEHVNIPLGARAYEIVIGSGWVRELPSVLPSDLRPTRFALVTDENVASHCGELVDGLRYAADVSRFVVRAGENSKSVSAADSLWRSFAEGGVDRKTVVIACGGGVVGDLAGFVAATFARGLSYVQVPTTLMALVDSSIGGKVAINLPQAKNMVGVFWQPRLVAADVAWLDTLPDREFLSGLAEVVKYGVIADAEFFAWLEDNVEAIRDRDHEALRRIVRRSCEIKSEFVAADERDETGRRALLNYGHTLAHAWESCTAYADLLHGEAVALGMHVAARIAHGLGWVNFDFVERQQRLLTRLGLRTSPGGKPIPAEDLLAATLRDKKMEHGELWMILPREVGRVERTKDASPESILAVLQSEA